MRLYLIPRPGFTRTFMELKLVKSFTVTIVVSCFTRTFMELKPWSDWNMGRHLPGFTRTFMELKLKWLSGNAFSGKCFTRTFMELKPNKIDVEIRLTLFYSYLYGIETFGRLGMFKNNNNVLLVPLWNWNLSISWMNTLTCRCFTRTFMELKLPSYVDYSCQQGSFTRTFMELKVIVRTVRFRTILTFYSYLYGIETWDKDHVTESGIPVLLVPLWNWN